MTSAYKDPIHSKFSVLPGGIPVTPGAFQTTSPDARKGFVAKIGPGSPLTVAITSPNNGAWTGNSIHVIATATDGAALATLKLYGDGVQFGATVICNGAASCTFDDWWSTGALASGQHTIVAVATDTSGNQTSSTPVTINK